MTKEEHLAKQIAREHAALRESIREIRSEVERLTADSPHDRTVGGLCKQLRDFATHAREHFELEERGGILSTSAEIALGQPGLVERLIGEHRDFEQRLTDILARAETVEASSGPLPDSLARALEHFLSDLLEHERAERVLLQESVYRDLGAGD